MANSTITVRLDTVQIADILKPVDAVIKTIKYIVGIAERGHGRKMRKDETAEAFVLGYVQLLEVKAAPQPMEWKEWRRMLCTKVDAYVNAEYEDDGDEDSTATYAELRRHILDVPFVAPE